MTTEAVGSTIRPERKRTGDEWPCPSWQQDVQDVAAVRHRARGLMADWEIPPDAADDALLVISELATNAVVHALPPVVLRMWRLPADRGCPVLCIEVTDAGLATAPACTDDLLPDEHGRGLSIVHALTMRSGTRIHSEGTTSWAVLPAA
ncbi:ATP-binding protein [Streptomyces sp. NPDC051976]|uniref:ATP-binding protein n=1 Tax=Streptomyces sp. NPDC051976 TaxID=3154947 RepID=UPI00343AB0B1